MIGLQNPRHRLLVVACVLVATSVQCKRPDFADPTDYFTSDSLHDKYDRQITFDQYLTYSMRSLALVAGYDNDLHRYDSKQDMIDSYERNLNLTPSGAAQPSYRYESDWAATNGGQLTRLRRHQRRQRLDSSELELFSDQSELKAIENDLNQEECSHQLDQLIEMSLRLFKNFESYSTSTHLSLIDFLDSYGSAPREQLLMGNNLWLGSHEQCSRARVSLARARQEERVNTARASMSGRYCVAKLRSPNWPAELQPQGTGDQSIRLGVCLPQACNSISILRHSSKLETLIRLVRLQQVPFSSYRLQSLYCLPDESSPLRQLSPSARIFVTSLGAWLTFVLYFSLKYEIALARAGEEGRQLDERALSKWIKIFAFRYCWRVLFADTTSAATGRGGDGGAKQPSLFLQANLLQHPHPHPQRAYLVWTGPSRYNQDSGKALVGAADCRLASTKASTGGDEEPRTRKLDLAAIDGIKVLSMIWLISAHTMLFFVRLISNGRDFWSIVMDARFLTIMAGIFPVDSFFTVTGILTAYLKFNRDQGKAMRRPSYWLEAFVHRYLRFMPMYLVVFWYTRDVSQYIGQGPLWDYATANTSLRSMCKQESISVPLLFQANFKPIDQHCVKPAWYLANDYQYLLITPIYIGLLMCSKWLGYTAIIFSVASSLVAQFYTVYFDSNFTDHQGLVNFKPMFATYVLKDLWRLYTLPYNRIAPYLIGLMTGHLMYSLDKESAVADGRSVVAEQQQASQPRETTTSNLKHNNYSEQFKCKHGTNSSSGNHDSQAQYQFHFHRPQPPLPPHSLIPHHLNLHDSIKPNVITVEGSYLMMPMAGAMEISHRHQAQYSDNSKVNSNESPSDDDSSTTTAKSSAPASQQIGGNSSMENNVQATGSGGGSEKQTNNKHNSLSLSSFLRHHLCIRVWTPLMLLISIIYLPMLTKLTTQEGEHARIGASLIMALMRFFWSIAIARLIYVCCCCTNNGLISSSTRMTKTATAAMTKSDSFIIGLLSLPLWRPWSKIGLSVLLIQWEIISYLAQMQTTPPFMSISYMLAFVLVSIVASYTIGLLVYLTIEFPLSQFEHYYIHPRLFGNKQSARQK